MPVWHEQTLDLQKEGRLQLVGLIQEQHPDRCRLFMQWKEMGWPILVDSLNRTRVYAVPLAWALDEHGIVRGVNPSSKWLRGEFLEKTWPAPEQPLEPVPLAEEPAGVQAFLAGRYQDAVAAFQKEVVRSPDDGPAWFGLGCAFRGRYDLGERLAGDFQQAVAAWTHALTLDPANYIWRRRIQQYGPRLEKPYPFYDWIAQARKDLRARGETPAPLVAEPIGSEIAHPARRFAAAQAGSAPAPVEPDPQGKLLRDEKGLVQPEIVIAPDPVQPGHSARIYVYLRPSRRLRAHFDPEGGTVQLQLKPPKGWQVDARLLTRVPQPFAPGGEAPLVRFEFEVQVPGSATAGKAALAAYVTYPVCEDVQGVCQYLRQDLEIPVPLGGSFSR
ncbi:MAG: hypothetical protein ACE5H3_06625 [Planctomycetota bacterium]